MTSQKMNSLFTYGSLQFLEVLDGLQIKYSSRSPATIGGFEVKLVTRGHFDNCPAAVSTQGGANCVEGFLLEGISDEQLAFLDFYEGDLYKRQVVSVKMGDGTHNKAYIYVWFGPIEILHGSWSKEIFAKRYLNKFVSQLQLKIRQYIVEEKPEYKAFVKNTAEIN